MGTIVTDGCQRPRAPLHCVGTIQEKETVMLKILIAIDGSELSLDAVRHALCWVQNGLQARFVLANVQEPATLYEIVVSRDPDLIAQASIQAATHLMAPALAILQAAGLECETEIGVGDPAHTLVDIIENTGCDAVLIGARGKGAITSALLGSVSQELAHASPVSVTIVHHLDAPLPEASLQDFTDPE